ncbi:MAG TPA: NAD(P)/FAD-dependent oxidoreductase [Vicinamibacterales bacterium]|jgi:monoamine oxidase|nr:NAD(P)/FAD-dependent oxidoreductase [Vicinamibacterales bacterium]
MLDGVSVLVAGAGLAGLAAARDLTARGAAVTVVDARDRVGGRVWTIRDGFVEGQYAEAGGEMIDEDQHAIRALADELNLKQTRIFRTGWGYARVDGSGRPRIVRRTAGLGWDRLARELEPAIEPYRLAEQRWDTPIATQVARRSVAAWLDDVNADEELRTTAAALRGFFLADTDELSLIALVDQFATDQDAAPGAMYRIEGGNDRLATALAAPLGSRLHLKTEVVAISHRGKAVRVAVKHAHVQSQLTCDYVVMAMPASVVRRIPCTPSLPSQQHDAFSRLKYGRATKTLLQFSKRFWRAPGRPRALGSALPIGALWDANEEQRGRAGILALVAGGSASDATQEIVAKDGPAGLVNALEWLGSKNAELLASRQIVWEQDPWARGGYAFFDPAFDPALRAWLARPFGRVFFAGEHTSIRWQGYMNGAVESGRRAAAEIAAVHQP